MDNDIGPFGYVEQRGSLLRQLGMVILHRHVAALMKKMTIEAICRHPSTSKSAPEHKIYPYLPRKTAAAFKEQIAICLQA